MAESSIDRKRLDELRKDILALAHAEAALRQLVQQYLAREQCSLNTVVLKVGSNWAAISNLVEGKRVIVKDTTLEGLARLTGMNAQATSEIIALSSRVPHRYLGLAVCSDEVIDTVFEVLVAHNAVASQYTMAEFAGGFSSHEQTVLGVLNLARDALEVLQNNPQVMYDILEVLMGDLLEQTLQEVKAAQSKSREALAAKISQLVGELLPRYPDKMTLVGDLGLPRGSLDPVKLQGASVLQLEKFISVLEGALGKITSPASEPEQLVQPSPSVDTAESVADPFEGLAGEEVHGVSHVLTAENFREIEGLSAAAVIAALSTSVQMTTGLLALVAQLKGDEIRELMQRPIIARKLKALYDALEIATTTHPQPLLKMFDEQRNLWGSLGNSNQTGKGGAAHA